MQAVLMTTNPVTLSYAEAILRDYGIDTQIFDRNISFVEGSIGAFPRRLMVLDEDVDRARQLLRDAGLEAELS